jgi:hypothetical protein
MTSFDTERMAVVALENGAASYVPKRRCTEVLKPTVSRLLALRKAVAASLPVRYFSCFIRHSHRDHSFCQQLYETLMGAGIQVWYAPKSMKGGRALRDQVQRAIYDYDKLLLVLSASSMASDWVSSEVLIAMDKERDHGQQALFPIRLAPYEDVQQWALFDSDRGLDIARYVRQYHIPDFSNWPDEDAFRESMQALVTDLARDSL